MIALAASLLVVAGGLAADRDQDLQNKQLGLQQGPLGADLGPATLQVTADEVFTGKDGAAKWLALTKNPASGLEVGLVGMPGGAIAVVEVAPGLVVDDADRDDLVPFVPSVPLAYDTKAHVVRWPAHAAVIGRKSVVLFTVAGGADDDPQKLAAALSWKPGEQFDARTTDELSKSKVVYGLRDLVAKSGVVLAEKKRHLDRRVLAAAAAVGVVVLGVLIGALVRASRARKAKREQHPA